MNLPRFGPHVAYDDMPQQPAHLDMISYHDGASHTITLIGMGNAGTPEGLTVFFI